jgi:predicted phage terminase large subunit-like protein
VSNNADLNVELLKWQQGVWTDGKRFQVIAAGRRCGKSRYSAWRMIVAALDGKPGEVWYVGLTQGNARDTMWRLLHELAGPVIKSSHVNNLQITLINGATISLKGSDRPETMRGSSLKLVVLDEAAFMKPFVWEEILRPALADQKGLAVFISTPDGRSWFYDLYVYADQSDDEDWAAYHLTSYDNELLDPKEIDAAKRSMSTMAFTQEFMASFNARESELFKEDWLIFDEEEPETGDYYIAIDPAGFEQLGKKGNKRLDDTAIAIVKVNEKGWWVKEIKYGRWTFDETVRHIFHAVQKFRPISVGIERGIAKQAMMSPLMDMMKRHNLFFRIEELTHGNINKANRVINALQGRMEHGRIVFNKGDWNIKLVDQLMQFPSPLTHDDLIDSLSYIDQLAHVAYSGNWEEYDDFEALDAVAGY